MPWVICWTGLAGGGRHDNEGRARGGLDSLQLRAYFALTVIGTGQSSSCGRTVKAGSEANFEALLTRMASRTKREDRGNIRYEFFRASTRSRSRSSPITCQSITYLKTRVNQQSVEAHLNGLCRSCKQNGSCYTKDGFFRLSPIE